MSRVIYINDKIGNKSKYVFLQSYREFTIYQRKTNSGYSVFQDYAITYDKPNIMAADRKIIICEPYNNLCLEELLDMIDEYRRCGRFGYKAFVEQSEDKYYTYYTLHQNGKIRI